MFQAAPRFAPAAGYPAGMTKNRAFETMDMLNPASCAVDWAYATALALLAEPVDEAILSVLAEIGPAADADRAWMFEYDAELLSFRNTHEWTRRGVEAFVQDLQDAPVTMIAWLHRQLVHGRAVLIHDVTALPRPARALQAEMLRQSDKSVLSVPVFHDGRLRACIGFDTTRAKKRWSGNEVIGLQRCATLIARARYGRMLREDYDETETVSYQPLVYLTRQGKMRGVRLDDILGLRSNHNYTDLWLADGSVVGDNRAFGTWVDLLPIASFLKVNRTAIVNLRHVTEVDRNAQGGRWEIRLRLLQQRWVVSRPYRQVLRQRLGI